MDLLQQITVVDIVVWLVEGVVAFAASTFIFDVVHWALHQWAKSPVKVLRVFSRWHHVHHAFLDRRMRVHKELVRANLWAHLVPEFITSVAGTAIFYLVFHWLPVTAVIALHIWMFANTIRAEGVDHNHMAMDRVSGNKGLLSVDPSYHAMHHIAPDNFYSSYFNVFDLLFGTACKIRNRTFLITGASGAYGSAMKQKLEALGGIVETAKSGVDFSAGDYGRMAEKLARADVLILAHGAKSGDCWDANYRTFVDLIDLFVAAGKQRLVPPEVWAVGSEAEFHGDMGMAELRDYAASKRAFARHALAYYLSPDVTYRHIVPSAFTSSMGKGAMSASFAVAYSLFFIRRGLTYAPVTLTTLAFWNYFRFRWPPKTAPSASLQGR